MGHRCCRAADERTAPHPHLTPCPLRRPPGSFLRKCVLSLEFVYLMIMTFAGTWFGIGVFYTILCARRRGAWHGQQVAVARLPRAA